MARNSDQSASASNAAPDGFRTAGYGELAGHYLHAVPSPILGIVGLFIALALLAFGISELRTGATRQTSLQVAAPGSAATQGAAIFHVTPESWAIDGQSVEENDLLFRLTAAAGRSPVIIIEHATGLSATRLTRALELVNQAGFTQVGVRSTDARNP